MPLNASILGQPTSISRTFMRQGSVFILDDAGTSTVAASIGRAKNITLGFEPINSEADSQGRESTMGYTINGAFTMMQTTADDLAVAFAMAAPLDTEDGANGFKILFSNVALTEAGALAAWNGAAGTLDGFGIVGAIIKPAPNVDFSGGESGIPCTFTGRVPADRVRTFNTTRKITLAL